MPNREEMLKFLNSKQSNSSGSAGKSREEMIQFLKEKRGSSNEEIEYVKDDNPLVDAFDKDRLILKNLLSSSGDVSQYQSKNNPNLRFERGEDGEIYTYEQGSNKRYALDPEGFDLGDIGDLAGDVVKTGGEIAAGIGGSIVATPAGGVAAAAGTGAALEAGRQYLGEMAGIPNNTENVGTDAAIDGALSLALPVAGKYAGKGLSKAAQSKLLEKGINKVRGNANSLRVKAREGLLKTIAPQDNEVLERAIKDSDYRDVVKGLDEQGADGLLDFNTALSKDAQKAMKLEEQRIWNKEMLPSREGMKQVRANELERSIRNGITELKEEGVEPRIIKKLQGIRKDVAKGYLEPKQAFDLKSKFWELSSSGKDLSQVNSVGAKKIGLLARRLNSKLDSNIMDAVKDPQRYSQANKSYTNLKNRLGKLGNNAQDKFSNAQKTMNTISMANRGIRGKGGSDMVAKSALETVQKLANKNKVPINFNEANMLNRGVIQLGPNLAADMTNRQAAAAIGDMAGTAAFAATRSFWPAKVANKLTGGIVDDLTKVEKVWEGIDRVVNLRKAGKTIGKSTAGGLKRAREAGDNIQKIFLPEEAYKGNILSPYMRPDRAIYNLSNDDDE